MNHSTLRNCGGCFIEKTETGESGLHILCEACYIEQEWIKKR